MLTRFSRRGVSLVELLVVLVVLGIAAGAVTRIAMHQQRHYGRLAARSLALARLREGGEVLSTGLAGLSPAAGDIYEGGMTPTSIEFRATLATGVLCAAPSLGENIIDLVRLSAIPLVIGTDGAGLSEDWISAGDSIWLYDASADTTGSVEAWQAHLVTGLARIRRRCPPASHDTDVLAARATLSPAVRTALEVHAPVRLFRRARFTLYAAGDGSSYLGFSDCRPVVREPACAPVQPVAGPYVTNARRPEGGSPRSTFEYVDANGTPTSNRLDVAGILLHLGANGAMQGRGAEILRVRRVIGLRNASP